MSSTTNKVGWAMTGCGCLTLGVISLWLVFVAIIGIQGRGNDEEASLIIGGVTCLLSLPVPIVILVGLVLGFKKPPQD